MKNELQKLARESAEVHVIIVNEFRTVGRIMDADESVVAIDVNSSYKAIDVNTASTVELLKGQRGR